MARTLVQPSNVGPKVMSDAYDEGVLAVSDVQIYDFVGAGVSAVDAGNNRVTVTIAGGGSQTPWTGNVDAATFTLTDVSEVWLGSGNAGVHGQDPSDASSGANLTVRGGDATSSGMGLNGGVLTLRGGQDIGIHGSSIGGDVILYGGSTSGTNGKVEIRQSDGSTPMITFDEDATNPVTLGGTLDLAGNALNVGAGGLIDMDQGAIYDLGNFIRFKPTGSETTIYPNSSDGSDNYALVLSAGGIPVGATRGAILELHGNEYATNPGQIDLKPGGGANVVLTGGNIDLNGNNITMGGGMISDALVLGGTLELGGQLDAATANIVEVHQYQSSVAYVDPKIQLRIERQDDAGYEPQLTGQRRGDAVSTQNAVNSGAGLLMLEGEGWDGTAYDVGARIKIQASEDWSGTQNGGKLIIEATADGGTSLAQVWEVTGGGVVTQTGALSIGGNLEMNNNAVNGINLLRANGTIFEVRNTSNVEIFKATTSGDFHLNALTMSGLSRLTMSGEIDLQANDIRSTSGGSLAIGGSGDGATGYSLDLLAYQPSGQSGGKAVNITAAASGFGTGAGGKVILTGGAGSGGAVGGHIELKPGDGGSLGDEHVIVKAPNAVIELEDLGGDPATLTNGLIWRNGTTIYVRSAGATTAL